MTETRTVTETAGADADSTGEPALTQRCDNAERGYTVRYPEGWHANRGDVSEACSFFHPEPFELPEQTEAPDVAVSISREPVPFDQVAGESPAIRISEREETEIDGRAAVSRVTEATGDGLLPAGVRGYQYLVDLDGETMILSTYDVGDLDFERNRDVLDRMAEALRLSDDAARAIAGSSRSASA